MKNIDHIAIEQIIPSLLVSRNNEMMKTKETSILDLNLLHHLYNTSVPLLVKITLTEQTTNIPNPMMDTVVEVHHVIVIQIAKLHHKVDIALTLETNKDMTELLLLHNLTDQDMTTIDEIHVRSQLPHTEIDFHNTLRTLDLLPNHESLDLSNLDQVLKQKIKSVASKQNNQIHLPTLKSICTILQKWATL